MQEVRGVPKRADQDRAGPATSTESRRAQDVCVVLCTLPPSISNPCMLAGVVLWFYLDVLSTKRSQKVTQDDLLMKNNCCFQPWSPAQSLNLRLSHTNTRWGRLSHVSDGFCIQQLSALSCQPTSLSLYECFMTQVMSTASRVLCTCHILWKKAIQG